MTYSYDDVGNRTQIVVGSDTTTYACDDNALITTVMPPSPTSAISYTCDDNGDLTDRGSDSSHPPAVSQKMAKGIEWDYRCPVVVSEGNCGREDRLVEADVDNVTTTFAYNGDGLGSSYPAVVSQETARGIMKTTDDTGAVVNAYTYDVYGNVTSSSGGQANEFQFAGDKPNGESSIDAAIGTPAPSSPAGPHKSRKCRNAPAPSAATINIWRLNPPPRRI